MGLAVVSKTYEFGLTYELATQESDPNESDKAAEEERQANLNSKFRLAPNLVNPNSGFSY